MLNRMHRDLIGFSSCLNQLDTYKVSYFHCIKRPTTKSIPNPLLERRATRFPMDIQPLKVFNPNNACERSGNLENDIITTLNNPLLICSWKVKPLVPSSHTNLIGKKLFPAHSNAHHQIVLVEIRLTKCIGIVNCRIVAFTDSNGKEDQQTRSATSI